MDYANQSPAILSLCTGGLRGIEEGFNDACDQLGWQRGTTAAYVEIEAFIIENLVQQMEQSVLAPAPIWSNIKTFISNPFRKRIDGIFGGYPCQPFSIAGNRKGTDDPRHLWPYIGKGNTSIAGTIKPVFCFFENVPGHLTLGYEEVRNDLFSLGYTVKEGIFSAAEVGAPHQRKRLFILAIKNNQLANTPCSKGAHRTIRAIEKQPRVRDTGFVWPARPGEKQFERESPRVKSRMGFTVNGYSFREDLLRMAGNGVVKQTATKAFLTLLNKHYGNN